MRLPARYPAAAGSEPAHVDGVVDHVGRMPVRPPDR